MRTWKKVTVASLFAVAASYGTVSVGEPEPATAYGLLPGRPIARAWGETKAWVSKHPALSGAIAGGIAGSWFPGIGTVAGIVTGAAVGSQVGSDERDSESHEIEKTKDAGEEETEESSPKPPEAERKW